MFKHEIEKTAPETLTDAQLEVVAGGIIIDGTGNISTCGGSQPTPPPVPHVPSLGAHIGRG